MNSDLFSVDYFKDALHLQLKKNGDAQTPVHTMNSYYHTVVSAIIQDRINKNFELMRRIRNLDTAYREVKEEIAAQQQMQQQ
ncbi:protein YvfG [Sporolactobacillus shoreicorticis]|uniref:Protein YvfG n=1 Tax=Sporolactobacillus shoreicorticis TaxID=1923877 RepID=A0ABW5RZB8_9BACL|nr:protein YvfG [Sporolactobacillus shoreicorticis]MCO7127630.1 protein YvfG [Sporolactobacillus shoreicorticis]